MASVEANDSSDEEVGEENWIFYKDRPGWADVTPVEQDDGPHPVVAIAYSDRFKDVFDYFRAVLLNGEKSERAFKLTTDALDFNPGNYTVWHYRRLILQELKKDLWAEVAFSREIIEEHPKNYQVWNHRRILIEWLQDPKHELRFVEIILSRDAKNYHAWQHRQWALKTFQIWDDELLYVESLLEEDIRNNSAWNQRHFVISNTTQYTPEVLRVEVDFAKDAIRTAVHNESPWNYLKGILSQELESDTPMYTYPGIQEFVENLLGREEGLQAPEKSSYLHSFHLDLIESELEEKQWSEDQKGKKHSLLDSASSICTTLANQIDPIRKNYWNYRNRSLRIKCGDGNEQTNNKT